MRPDIITRVEGEIEWTAIDGKMWRVYRPFKNSEWFLLPMISLADERRIDAELRKRIRSGGKPPIPVPHEYTEPDDLMDNANNNAFTGESRGNAEEASS